jgi:small multidrug resistance pump
MSPGYLYLAIAIAAEVVATSALKASDGFTRPGPSLIVAAYAIWSGVGIVLIALIGWAVLKQPLDLPALVGIGLIVAGVAVIQLFSKASAH